MGRFVSAVTRRAASKGSAVFLTQMLRVSLQGLRKATYWPSGESWAAEISGLPKNSSRSRTGGGAAAAAPATRPKASARHARRAVRTGRLMGSRPPSKGDTAGPPGGVSRASGKRRGRRSGTRLDHSRDAVRKGGGGVPWASEGSMDNGPALLIRFRAGDRRWLPKRRNPRTLTSTRRRSSRSRSARGRCGSCSIAASCAGSASASERSCAASTWPSARRAGPPCPPSSRTWRSRRSPRPSASASVARHRRGGVRFDWVGRIQGGTDGRITYSMDGAAGSTFRRNRIGFCVLHPAEACAGRPCIVETVDGDRASSVLPQPRRAAPAVPQRARDPARGDARRRGRGADGGGDVRDRGPAQLVRRVVQDLRDAAAPPVPGGGGRGDAPRAVRDRPPVRRDQRAGAARPPPPCPAPSRRSATARSR